METLTLLLLLHVVVVLAFVSARAIHVRLAPVEPPPLAAHAGAAAAPDASPPLLSNRQLEEYVESGLHDLRIMLAQAARRHRE